MRGSRPAANLTIVTGASSNHYRCLRNLVTGIRAHEPLARLAIYDLGLTEAEAGQIDGEHPGTVRRFPFEKHPDWVRIDASRGDYARRAGCYAWKAAILWEIARECPGLVLWLDAGDLVRAPLTAVRAELLRGGLFTPASLDAVRRWTHPATLAFFPSLDAAVLEKPNRNAAIIGVNTEIAACAALLEKFRDLSLRHEAIAPPGASWANHRFDQSLLTLLAYEWEARTGGALRTDCPEITTHHDFETEISARVLMGL